ncbi:MAG: nuclear transport factor 2 family protein [Actinomycetota bacterium]|nr:nuclear transport factor 2 family protein [Actinomycetota bacterium]
MSAGDRRNAIENLLYRYAQLADDLDAAGVADLLAAATVQIGDKAPVAGAELVELFRGMFAGTPAGRHLLSNMVITESPHGAQSSCRYVRWVLGNPPTVVSIGVYQATFRADAGVWAFDSLRVIREWG